MPARPNRRSPRFLIVLAVVAALVVPVAGAAASAGASRVTWTRGTPWTGSEPVHRTNGQIMRRQARVDAHGGTPAHELPELEQPDRSGLPQNALSPEAAGGVTSAPARAQGPRTGQTTGTNFNGVTGPDETGSFPPDTMGAVGPTQFLVGVNGRIRVFDKSGVMGVLNSDMDVFFSDVISPGSYTSDPRVRYDRLSQRWFVIIIDVERPNRVLLAVSDTSTVTTKSGWNFYYFLHSSVTPAAHSTCLADYPTLGIDASALYIGVNQFCGAGLAFTNTDLFVVSKSSITGGGPIVVTAFRNLINTSTFVGAYTPQGVDNPDPSATTGYVIGVDAYAYGKLDLRRVSTPGGTPSISSNVAITIPTTSAPITVPHLGNTIIGSDGELDALDDRLFAATVRGGELWTAHNIGVNSSGTTSSPTRDAVRWYRIGSLGGTPTVNDSGTIYDGTASNPLFYWIPSVMVSGQGHAVLGMSVAGNTAYANSAWTAMNAGEGDFAAPSLYTAASAAYNPSGDPGGAGGRRWGDYSYTSLDPCDDMTLWTIQEYTSAANKYGTRVLEVSAPPPATPTSASASVPAGQSSANVTITGTSSSGSGFYDPGSGSCRIGAAVSGGVVVNSVTYTDATHVTLNLDTTGASEGTKNVTITNPDGQSATGAGILTISAASSASADLSATITSAPLSVNVGNDATFVTTIANAGPDSATAPSVVVSLPADAVLASATSSTGVCVGTGPVTCTLADLVNGGSATVTIVTAPTVSGANLFGVTVSSSTSDPSAVNDDDAATTTALGKTCTKVGTMAGDTLGGTSANNVICGLRGADVINGAGGNDTLYGNGGADDITGGKGGELLMGLDGNDHLDSMDGVSGNDTDKGGKGNDTCVADSGDVKKSC